MDVCHGNMCVMRSSEGTLGRRGGGKESLSAKEGDTGQIDLVEELDQLDKDDEEDMVQVELK